jgi:hypothetical protein
MAETTDDWQMERSMSPRAYGRAIRALGLNQASAGRYLGVSARTSRRYLSGDAMIPAAQVLLLRACIAHKVEPLVPKWIRGSN